MMPLGMESLEKREPRVTVDLDKDLAKESRQYRPGSMVKLVIIGSIDSVSYRKPDDPDEKGYEGYLCVKASKMELLSSARNEMAELLDDDE